MTSGRAASIAAVLGGLVWVAAAALDWGDDVNPIAYLVGLVWFVVSLAALGYSLTAKAPVWLRGIVSLATPALGFMVWVTLRDPFLTNDLPVGVAGVMMVASGVRGVRRAKPKVRREAPVRGRRAAR